MAKATSDNLGDLHRVLAEYYTSVLKGEIKDEAGTELRLNASMVNSIRQFLKDNRIEADLVPGSPLEELTDNLPDFDAEGRVVQFPR